MERDWQGSRMPDPAASCDGVTQEEGRQGGNEPVAELLQQATERLLIDQGRAMDTGRLAALAKRLAAAALVIQPGPALALLDVLSRLLR